MSNRVLIPEFKGTLKISDLDCYPIKYHANEVELRKALVARGRKWASYRGVHHVLYKGTAVFCPPGCKPIKYNVCDCACLQVLLLK